MALRLLRERAVGQSRKFCGRVAPVEYQNDGHTGDFRGREKREGQFCDFHAAIGSAHSASRPALLRQFALSIGDFTDSAIKPGLGKIGQRVECTLWDGQT